MEASRNKAECVVSVVAWRLVCTRRGFCGRFGSRLKFSSLPMTCRHDFLCAESIRSKTESLNH